MPEIEPNFQLLTKLELEFHTYVGRSRYGTDSVRGDTAVDPLN